MLKRLLPVGTILKNVFLEVTEQDRFTHGRQIGTYPLLLTIPFITDINTVIMVPTFETIIKPTIM